MIFILRDYQKKFYENMKKSIKAGNHRIMCVAPCGSGKSVIIEEIIKSAEGKNNSVLVLVHRIEIADQLKERLFKYKNATVNMVQTVIRHLNDFKEPKIIIIDEAHTALSESYLKILDFFKNSYALYFTATPQRLDGKGFCRIADDLVNSVSVKWLINNNYLASYEYYAPKTIVNSEQLHIKNGDYDGKQAFSLMDKSKIYGDVIAEYKKYAKNLQAIAYCSSVEHSKKTAEAFNAAGIAAAHIDGVMSKKKRAEIIKDFKEKKIMVLTNYAIVIEGFDVPDTACTLCLRPTKSLTVHIQSTMRCMRPAKNKKAIILDFVGNYEKLGLPDDDRQWTLDGINKKIKEKNTIHARVCQSCFKAYAGQGRICPYCGHDNGKTKQEIEQEKQAELVRVTTEQQKQKRKEVGRARTKEELERIAKERGYAPGWVYIQMRLKKI